MESSIDKDSPEATLYMINILTRGHYKNLIMQYSPEISLTIEGNL